MGAKCDPTCLREHCRLGRREQRAGSNQLSSTTQKAQASDEAIADCPFRLDGFIFQNRSKLCGRQSDPQAFFLVLDHSPIGAHCQSSHRQLRFLDKC